MRTRSLVWAGSLNIVSWLVAATAQVLYAGITARLFPPSVFGAYSVAITGLIIVSLSIGSGLPAALMRAPSLSYSEEAAYVGRSLISGVLMALTLLAAGQLWADLWRNASAGPLTQILAIAALGTPLSTVLIGIQRRQGDHNHAAAVVLVASVLSTAVGIATALVFRTPESLLSSNIALVWLIVAGCIVLGAGRRPVFGRDLPESAFVRKSVALNLLNYIASNLMAWSASWFITPASLGLYSRALLLSQMPADRLTAGGTAVLFTEYRKIEEVSRRRSAVSDAVVLITATVAMALGLISVMVTLVIRVVLGGGKWNSAIPLLAVLSMSLFFAAPQGVLASALHERGHFRTIYAGQFAGTMAAGMFVVLIALTTDVYWAAWGSGAVYLASHAVNLRAASSRGLILGREVSRAYLLIALAVGPMWTVGLVQATNLWRPASLGAFAFNLLLALLGACFAALVMLRGPVGRVLVRREIVLPDTPRLGWLLPSAD